MRMRPQVTHDQATRNFSSSRISNTSGSPQVGQVRRSAGRALMRPAYDRRRVGLAAAR